MRSKPSSTLLTAMLILASGCHKLSTESSRELSQANESFGIAQAMKMFYGNYDVKSQTSVALLPQWKGSSPPAGEVQVTVRPLFNTFSGNAGAQIFVLVTYAVPPDYGCHSCAPMIGMAVFCQKGLKWTMDASNRAVTCAGEWGNPPTDTELVQIGPNRHAVEVLDSGGGQGETMMVLQLLIPWNGTVNVGLSRVMYDNNLLGCDSQEGGHVPFPCDENRREVNFIRNDKVEYYNLELELTGTDLTGDAGTSMGARKVHGLETLKFENGKYVQVSRQSDLTSVELFAAETLSSVHFADGSRGWGAGSGKILATSDGGATVDIDIGEDGCPLNCPPVVHALLERRPL